jgi:dTDP-4-amino-4,6-dideoxygalactose transaminase
MHKPDDFPKAHANQSEILSLPMFPELSNVQIDFVSKSIKAFYA